MYALVSFSLAFPEDQRRQDLDVSEALDVLFAIDSAAFVRILIDDRGWSYDRYEAWLATILQQLFLEPA